MVLRIGNRHRGEKGLGVGMQGVAQQLLRICHFHYLPHVHHGDPIAHVPGDCQIVGDVEVGDSHALGKLLHQQHDSRATGHIQHGGRFVGNDQGRADDECASDGDPLALPSRKLMGVSEQESCRRGESNQSEDFGNPVHPVEYIPDFLDRQRFCDGVVDRPSGIHRFVGILEDQLDMTTEVSHLPSRQRGRINTSLQRCVLGVARGN